MWLQEKIQSSKLSCSNIRKKAKKNNDTGKSCSPFPTNFLKGFGCLSLKIHIFIYHITFRSKTCSKWFQSCCFKVDVK